jgi:hypothetical protein
VGGFCLTHGPFLTSVRLLKMPAGVSADTVPLPRQMKRVIPYTRAEKFYSHSFRWAPWYIPRGYASRSLQLPVLRLFPGSFPCGHGYAAPLAAPPPLRSTLIGSISGL